MTKIRFFLLTLVVLLGRSYASAGASNRSLLNLFHNYSESVTVYSYDHLQRLGLNAGDKITSITFRGYCTNDKDFSTFLNVWYELSFDQTPGKPADGWYDTDSPDMIQILSNDEHTWTKVGSNTEYADLITINLSEPFFIEPNKSLKIVVCSKGDKYSSGIYFETYDTPGGTSGTSYYISSDDENLNSSYWLQNLYLPAIYFCVKSRLIGKVTDAGNDPVEGATLTIRNKEHNINCSATTDYQGIYGLDVANGMMNYKVVVEKEGLVSEVLDVKPKNYSSLDFTLKVPEYGVIYSSGSSETMDFSAGYFKYLLERDDKIVVTTGGGAKIVTIYDDNGNALGYKTLENNDQGIAEGELVLDYDMVANLAEGLYATINIDRGWINEVKLVRGNYVVLDDSQENPDFEFQDDVIVKVRRNFIKGWNALCLPIELTIDDVTAGFGFDAEVAVYEGDKSYADGVIVKFKTFRDIIPAGKPFLLYCPSRNITEVRYVHRNLSCTSPICDSENSTYFDFVGVYEKTDVKPGEYFLSATTGQFKRATSNNKVKAFRSYLRLKDDNANNARKVSFEIDDDIVHAIEGLTVVGQGDVDAIYNLNGQKVEQPAKRGHYIINGKKVMVK